MSTRRIIKFGIAAGAVGLSVAALQKNKWEVSTIGLLRFGRAAITVGKIAVDYKMTLHGLDTSTQKYEELKSQVHFRSAQKLLDLCCKNGGVFIKVGQHIGALNYLLPYEYVSTLKVLHSTAPKAPLDDVLYVLRKDLGKEPSVVFKNFESEPLGAASLAQVHRATLHDGKEVAVKVQHRNVLSHAMVDMATMELLINLVAWMFPEFTFLWLADETKRNLPLELDFLHEGHNAERVGRMFSSFSWLKVPKIYWELSTHRVLTMEYCEGGQVNDNDYIEKNRISAAEVSQKLGKLYSDMIFVQGYVHCDPHPGNILVQKNNCGAKIVLLDHGLYLTLTDKFRMNYCNMWMALLHADVKGVERWGRELGVGDLYGLLACMMTARSWKAVQKGIEVQKPTAEEKQEIRDHAAMYFPQITTVLSRVPREMLLIFKTNDLLRGIESSLGVKGAAGSFIAMSRCCVKALYDQQLKSCKSWWGRLRIKFSCAVAQTRISLYQYYQWFSSSFIGSWFSRLKIL